MNLSPSMVSDWFHHPLAETLLKFNLLPSLFAHPLRDAPISRQLKQLPALDRHKSAALLRKHKLGYVLSMEDPALVLALLPKAHFARLMGLLGAALNAPHIRRTISRIDRAALHDQIGGEAMAIVREPVAAALAGMPVAPDWETSRAQDICFAWGAAILAQAFDAATPEVAGRARLRLAPEADSLRAPLSAAGLEPERALRICLDLLQVLEPAWVSSFPATR